MALWSLIIPENVTHEQQMYFHFLQGFSDDHEVSLLQGKFTGKEKKFDASSDLIDLCGPHVH